MKISKLLFSSCILILLLSCEKEVPIPKMSYAPQIVVEAYLEPGKPFYLNLSQSSNYSKVEVDLIYKALVLISYDNIIDTIKTETYYDKETGRHYFYSDSLLIVPYNYTSVFHIEATDTLTGRKISADTKLLPIIPIDTIKTSSSNGNFEVTCEFKDNPETQDYYRLVVNRDLKGSAIIDTIFDDSKLSVSNFYSSGYVFSSGDSAFVSLYHIDYNYFSYLFTIQQSMNASVNPIAPPTKIQSNINNGLGIFTGLSYDRKRMRID